MSDLPMGLAPQFTKPEEATVDLLSQILVELKKINTQLVFITDQYIKEQDIIDEDKEGIDEWNINKGGIFITVIKDGSGSGFLAKVDDDNFLHVSARTFKIAAYASISAGKLFAIVGTTTIAASVEKTVLVLINNTTSGINIGLESHTMAVQGDSGHPCTVKIYLGHKTYTSGGTVLTPVDCNTGILQSLDTTTVADNPTLGGTDALIAEKIFEATTTLDYIQDAKRVLAPSGSFRVTVTGDPGAAGTKIIASTVEYFEIDLQSLE